MKLNSPKKLFLFFVFMFVLLSVVGEISPACASPAVATVQNVKGTASIVRQGQTIVATTGQEIWENDTLRTGPGGSMGVLFTDDTSVSLGPESVLVIDKFVFAPKEGKFAIALKLVKGTAAYLSGLIAKLSPESARFETPTASIGIRGTKFVAKVEEK
jgi:hypothetical protein